MKVTNEQWDRYQERYGKLIWTIATKISGDLATCSLEDNIADLSIAALDSIKGFNNKTGMNFDEMMESKLFDGYTKTVLWHRKNRKGKAITNRKKLLGFLSIDTVNNSSDDKDASLLNTLEARPENLKPEYDEMLEMVSNLTDEEAKVVHTIAHYPEAVSEKAYIQIKTVSDISGLSSRKVTNAVEGLKKKLRMFHE